MATEAKGKAAAKSDDRQVPATAGSRYPFRMLHSEIDRLFDDF
jgi:hypothetical protein